jgi:hypothetical protein
MRPFWNASDLIVGIDATGVGHRIIRCSNVCLSGLAN